MNKIKYFLKIKNFFRLKGSGKVKFTLGMVVGVAVGIAIGGYFIAYAQQFIDSFLDTSRVANTWNVEVDTTNGEVKLAQRSCDNSVWFCDLTWRCPGLAGDGNGLLVKRANEASALQWKIWQTACDTPECGIDGAQAGDNLTVDNTIDLIAHYPARQACKDVGGRLPTIAELQCIFSYKTLFGNNFGDNYYWSSEENANASYARYVYSYNNSIGDSYKSYNQYVRCVRGW